MIDETGWRRRRRQLPDGLKENRKLWTFERRSTRSHVLYKLLSKTLLPCRKALWAMNADRYCCRLALGGSEIWATKLEQRTSFSMCLNILNKTNTHVKPYISTHKDGVIFEELSKITSKESSQFSANLWISHFHEPGSFPLQCMTINCW
jgi:hypothetical protein